MRLRFATVLTAVAITGATALPGRGAENPEPLTAPFHRGVNLTGWLQAAGPRQIQFTRFTRQDFANIKSLGCDVIRLPINLHFMTDGPPDYTIDRLFFYFLDQIIDWAEELELHLILDNHTFDVTSDTEPNVGEVLIPVWTQMAQRYKDRSSYLYYEVLNEPHGIADATWAHIQQKVVSAIRAADPNHTIVVTGAGWGSYNNLKHLPVRADCNLIYSFHFYDPFVFTHQGASWVEPSMVPLAGVPFPHGVDPMPACPAELEGSWIESGLNAYHNDGTEARVRQLIDVAVEFSTSRGVPVFCGEFGVYRRNSEDRHRVYWYDLVRRYLEEKGIPWTIWDYQGGFGLFEQDTNELFEHDLNLPLVEALGLTAPEQTPFVPTAERAGFDLYADYFAPRVFDSTWLSQGTLDYYCDSEPAEGNYCLSCTGLAQYNAIAFDFRPDKDLAWLARWHSALEFWVRGDTPGARFEARFLDSKSSETDRPWRRGAAVDETMVLWDGQWHLVRIPLSDLTERGAWDDGWYNPQGLFDWTAVDRFEIVAEYHDLVGINFWFDALRLTDPTRR
ncbi:MAG: glycoside hydrolase family 5 protein [Sedimentisphaerales bacterium]|nr:glycoside hydrolase family 5 protein [Sedimentisphaerales bacterium]